VNDTDADVLVVGSGVIGLTTAISLAESGLRVAVRTASPPEETTSAAAGAIWGPVMTGPPGRAREWARIGMAALRDQERDPAAGIRSRTGREVSRVPADPPAWTDLLADIRRCDDGDLPEGFVAGWRYTAPVVNMPVYLAYLRDRLDRAGGRLSVAPVASLAALAAEAPVVVNCSGVEARHLVPDPAVTPVRGQVVVVANPGIEEFYIDHSTETPDVIYLFPHESTVVLGGTVAEGDWDRRPRPEVAERILRDCVAVEPRLRGARIVAHRVGLRPSRPAVRLEAEPLDGGRVLWHNYGHGGAGVTLSWGCAREITEAVLAGAPGPGGSAGPDAPAGPGPAEEGSHV
jgi:D-amino-acid oxidase